MSKNKTSRIEWIAIIGFFIMLTSPCVMAIDVRTGFIALGIGAIIQIVGFFNGVTIFRKR